MKPSDRAIAQAFAEWGDASYFIPVVELREKIYARARELDATAAPSDILPIDAGNAADWLDRASSKWEHGPAAINPADALRLRSIAALLRATAAPVVVGEVTDAMVERALNAQPFDDDNDASRVWQCLPYDDAGCKHIIRAALTAALAGD